MKMKRNAQQVLASACCMLLPLASRAQQTSTEVRPFERRLSGGPQVEALVSGFHTADFSQAHSTLQGGASVGGWLNYQFAPHFAIQPEMNFQLRRSRFSWSRGGGDFAQVGQEIAAYIMGGHTFRRGGRLFVGVGPYANFALWARYGTTGHKIDPYKKDTDTGLAPLHDTDMGFALKACYTFPFGLQLHATARGCISNIVDTNSGPVKMFPVALGVGAGWSFGK